MYRILDLTDEKGLLCGRILADLGLDVIKIEKPGGDDCRNIGPFWKDIHHAEKSLFWFSYNLNKKGITLDIMKRRGQSLFKQLVERADAIIESFPPSYLSELGLDYDSLARGKPNLVMTSITHYGKSGPYKDRKSSDLVANAVGGYVYITGPADRPPVRISKVDQAYCHAGSHAAVGTLIALICRNRLGLGQHVDISIEESVVWTLMYVQQYWDLTGYIYPRSGVFAHRTNLNVRQYWPCKDGYVGWRIFLGSSGGSFGGEGVKRMVEAMGEEGMAQGLDMVHWEASGMDDVTQEDITFWEERFASFFLTHTKRELNNIAERKGIPLFPISTPADLIDNVQLNSRHYWVDIEHPELSDTIIYPGPFVLCDPPLGELRRRAPLVGEHNSEIYEQELGISPQEMTDLKEEGVI